MNIITKWLTRLLNGTIAVFLSLMALFIFSNVILRYFFNYSLTWTEEASRYLFVWLIFLGAIVAFKENAHLGVDTLIQHLSDKGRKVLFVINNTLILITMLMVMKGDWQVMEVTASQTSPSLNLPLVFVYASGFIMSVGIGGISAYNLYRLLTRKVAAEDLVMITDSEDRDKIECASGHVEGGTKL